jgi:cold shock protein
LTALHSREKIAIIQLFFDKNVLVVVFRIIFRNYLINNSSIPMKTGTIKFFNATKGFGFIVDDESKKEVFVHITGLIDQPVNTGDAVSFELIDGRKGQNAVNVKKI